MCIRILCSLVLLFACRPVWDASAVEHQAAFTGRWAAVANVAGDIAMKTIRQGDAFRLLVSGSKSISVEFSAPSSSLSPVISTYLDGTWHGHEEVIGVGPLVIAKGLDPSREYTIEVRVAGLHEHDPKWMGDAGLIVHKIFAEEGRVTPWVDKRMGLLLIGDSITEGVAAKGQPGVSSPLNSVGDATYGRLAAELLGLRAVFNGFGGTGLLVGGSGGVPPAPTNAFQFNASTAQKFGNERINVVVVNLGTNDPKEDRTYADTYAAFLLRLSKTFEPKFIYAMRPFNGAYSSSIKAAAETAGAEFIDTADWLSEEDFFDGTHPTSAGHEKAARRLADFLSERMHE